MCGPAALGPLLIASTAMAAVGTGVGAFQANAQARHAARLAERNAAIEREAARQSILTAEDERLAHYRKIAALKGAQRARAAAAGVDVNFGTAADLIADTEMLGREDIARINARAEQRTRGFEIDASNFMGEASAQRQAGAGALVRGAFNFGSTVLGGATQYARMKPNYGSTSMPISGWGMPAIY